MAVTLEQPSDDDGVALADWAEQLVLLEGREAMSRTELLESASLQPEAAALDECFSELRRRSRLAPTSYPLAVTAEGTLVYRDVDRRPYTALSWLAAQSAQPVRAARAELLRPAFETLVMQALVGRGEGCDAAARVQGDDTVDQAERIARQLGIEPVDDDVDVSAALTNAHVVAVRGGDLLVVECELADSPPAAEARPDEDVLARWLGRRRTRTLRVGVEAADAPSSDGRRDRLWLCASIDAAALDAEVMIMLERGASEAADVDLGVETPARTAKAPDRMRSGFGHWALAPRPPG